MLLRYLESRPLCPEGWSELSLNESRWTPVDRLVTHLLARWSGIASRSNGIDSGGTWETVTVISQEKVELALDFNFGIF